MNHVGITWLLYIVMAVPCLALAAISFYYHGIESTGYELAARLFRGYLFLLLPVWLVSWAAMAIIWWNRALKPNGQHLALFLVPLILALIGAISPPLLSDDIFRYLWEGKVILSGENPYLYAPDSVELAVLAARYPDLHESINHPELSAIYPPLAQFVFAVVSLLSTSTVLIKLAMVAIAAASVRLAYSFFNESGIPTGRALLYAAHPLLITECGFGGHLDVMLLAGAVLAFWAATTIAEGNSARNCVFLVIGFVITVLTKLAPIVLFPHMLNATRSKRRMFLAALLVIVICVLFYLPFIGAGSELFSSLGTYNKKWEHNGLIYSYLVDGWLAIDPDGELINGVVNGVGRTVGYEDYSAQIRHADGFYPMSPAQLGARLTAALIFAMMWFWSLRRQGGFARQWMLVVSTGLLLSPVVHPWYLLALLPVVFLHGKWPMVLLWWTLTIPFSYAVLPQWWTQEEWNVPQWALWLQYGGMAVVLGVLFLWSEVRRTPETGTFAGGN